MYPGLTAVIWSLMTASSEAYPTRDVGEGKGLCKALQGSLLACPYLEPTFLCRIPCVCIFLQFQFPSVVNVIGFKERRGDQINEGGSFTVYRRKRMRVVRKEKNKINSI